MAGKLNDLQRAWVEYLRDNPEKQTIGTLRNVDGCMCCLGAAAQVMMDRGELNGFGWEPGFGEGNYLFDEETNESELAFLPSRAWGMLGLRDQFGKLQETVWFGEAHYQTLVEMNDYGMSWPEIADYIEANPGNVFTNHEGA